ncbi:hypothetical protein BpsS140_00013 [Bacillus phage vB_BpsS-140]|nr:hypothetical protein BpsS140_00013 [Bacillus phage vB_BpsS-140]
MSSVKAQMTYEVLDFMNSEFNDRILQLRERELNNGWKFSGLRELSTESQVYRIRRTELVFHKGDTVAVWRCILTIESGAIIMEFHHETAHKSLWNNDYPHDDWRKLI